MAGHRRLMMHGLVVRRQGHAQRWQAIRLAHAGPPVLDQHRYGHPPRRVQAPYIQVMSPLLLDRPLGLVPVVLEPYLDLCRRQSYQAGEVFPLGSRQVPLLTEASFKLVSLCLWKEYSSFAFLVREAVGARVDGRFVVVFVVVFDVVLVVVFVLVLVPGVRHRRRRCRRTHVRKFRSTRCAVGTCLLANNTYDKRKLIISQVNYKYVTYGNEELVVL